MIRRHVTVVLALALFACAQRPYSDGDDAQIIQAVLDHPTLAGFFHPEVPGRVPVKLAMPDSRHVPLSKFGQPVAIVPWSEEPHAAVILVEQFTGQDKEAFVRLVYPVEGVVGEFELSLQGKQWVIVKAHVRET